MATTTTETGTTETNETVGHEEGHKAGMPQLDTTTWVPQLFWVAIAFIALYVIISRVAIPGIGGAIENRKKTIANDLAAAQKLKTETENAVKSYEAALAEARAKANAIAAENRAKLQAEVDAESKKVADSIGSKVAAAEKTIAASKAKAMADVESVAADLAGEIVASLTGAKVTKADLAKAVKQNS